MGCAHRHRHTHTHTHTHTQEESRAPVRGLCSHQFGGSHTHTGGIQSPRAWVVLPSVWGFPHPTVPGKHCSSPLRTASIPLSVQPEPGSLPDLWCQFICILPQILAGVDGACDLLSPWVLKTSVSPCCTLCRLFFCDLYLIFNASHLA